MTIKRTDDASAGRGRKPPGLPLFEHDSGIMNKPTLVGISFRKGAKEALAMMRKQGIPPLVVLMREPTNPHDRNAIRVFCRLPDFSEAEVAALRAAGCIAQFGDKLMLGYVDRVSAATMAPGLDARAKSTPPMAVLDVNDNPPSLSPLID